MADRDELTATGGPLAQSPVARGLARLIEAQFRFAEEFGLSSARVFPRGMQPLQDRLLETAWERWLGRGEDLGELEWLLADLLEHQLALSLALDGIAAEALEQAGRCGWRTFQRRQTEWVNNPALRHLRLVLPGFLTGYIRARESGGATTRPAKEVK